LNNFKLTILGSSGALPAYGRFPTSQYLTIQNRHFLIDAGEGTQMQMGLYNVGAFRINHIFISHLHGDHYLGLMGLLFSMHLQRRETDVHLYGFRGLDEILVTQMKHSRSVLNFKVIFHTLNEGASEIVFEDEALSVATIPLDHRLPTSGFLFREKDRGLRIDKGKLKEGMLLQHIVQLKRGEDVLDEKGGVLYRSSDYTLPARSSRSYAYCSDTQPRANITQQVSGVDLLYHEATFMEDEKEKARETHHSTAGEAAIVAREAGVKRLLIGHFSARYKELSTVLEEARKIFPETHLATEGTIFEIPD
jgi:ribonuclease Z